MKTFLDVTSIGYALVSSFFLVLSVLGDTPAQIFSETIGEHNLSRNIYSRCKLRAITFISSFSIFISFIIGLIQIARPLTWDDLDFHLSGLISALLVLGISVKKGLDMSKSLRKKYYNEAKEIFLKSALHVEDYPEIDKDSKF